MPIARIGYGTDFILKDQGVGIGTDTAGVKLEVGGTTKANYNITGIASLTNYAGFAAAEQNIVGIRTVTGEHSTLGDIVVGVGSVLHVSTGATVYGTGALNIPVGTTAERPPAGDSPENGDIRYNTTLNSYEGYGNGAWGGLGGGTEIDTSVSSTAATSITTFVHAEHRSAYFRVQIVQGSAYQVGRYLLIHDGTTVTVVEESAIATGSMLGTITAAIVSTNVVIYVNMGSNSAATVTTIIDKITV